jgi:hypothetical protein
VSLSFRLKTDASNVKKILTAALVVVSVVLGTAAAASASAQAHVLSSQSASGMFSTAALSVTTHNARPIIFVATGGPSSVFWTTACARGDFNITSHGGTFHGPATKVVTPQAGTSYCTVIASAGGTGGGTVTLKVEQ